jgi:hypothetical protein
MIKIVGISPGFPRNRTERREKRKEKREKRKERETAKCRQRSAWHYQSQRMNREEREGREDFFGIEHG